MSAGEKYPPVVVPGTSHALRHLPFIPRSLEGEFHALAAMHLGRAYATDDADLALNAWAISNGFTHHDHSTIWQFFKEQSK